MVRCSSCDAKRGFWGRFTWARCENDHHYCPTCFDKLADASHEGIASRSCKECGAEIRIPVAVDYRD